ncbi:DUF4386 domain-containing protein [Actinomycetes bacterium KLBMP 9797]
MVNVRLAGALYLLIIVGGIFSQIVRTGLRVPGDATATAANIADAHWLYRTAFVVSLTFIVGEALLTLILYHLLRPVSATQSLLAAALRLLALPIYASALLCMIGALAAAREPRHAPLALFFLDLHDYGYAIGLTFFAAHCVVLGGLLVRASQVATALGVLLGVAGVGYLVNSLLYFLVPGYDGAVTPLLLLPAIVAETWLCVRLLRNRPLT